MKSIKFYALLFVSAVFIFSCSTEDVLLDEFMTSQHEEVIIEDVSPGEMAKEDRIADVSTGDATDLRGFNSCSERKPYDISKFRDALDITKYERNNSSSSSSSSAYNAKNHCEYGKFFTSGTSWMVLKSDGAKDHRSELKLSGSVDFDKRNIMRTEAIIKHVPYDSGRGLTIAQIHNRYLSGMGESGRPLLRAEIIDGKIYVVYAHRPYKYEDSRTGKKSEQGTPYAVKTKNTSYEIGTFNNGDRIYIKLDIKGDGKKVNYYIKNKTTGKSKSKTITVHESWRNSNSIKDRYYFKAGPYQQAKSSGSNPQMSFSRLDFDLD